MRLSNPVKEKLVELRTHGYSIPEISRMLGLSKSTVSRYVREVGISPEFYSRWSDRKNASKIIAEKHWKNAHEHAFELLPGVTKRDLMLLGAMLYWAEGTKKDFSFTNSDPQMVKTFVNVLRKGFGVGDASLKVSIRLFEDMDPAENLDFWSEIIGLDLKQGCTVNVQKGKKQGSLAHGMCRIRVRKGGLLLKSFYAINKRVSELVDAYNTI